MQKSLDSLASVCLLFKEWLVTSTQKPKGFFIEIVHGMIMLLYEIFSIFYMYLYLILRNLDELIWVLLCSWFKQVPINRSMINSIIMFYHITPVLRILYALV